MLAYLRRLLEPPRLKDIWLWLGILIASQELTKYLLLGFVLIKSDGLPLAVIADVLIVKSLLQFFCMGPGLRPTMVAAGAEVVVLSTVFSSSEEGWVWTAAGVLAAIISLAVFSERMKSWEMEK